MKPPFRFDPLAGIVDAQDAQVLQLVANHCSQRFRAMAGKELVKHLNRERVTEKKRADAVLRALTYARELERELAQLRSAATTALHTIPDGPVKYQLETALAP